MGNGVYVFESTLSDRGAYTGACGEGKQNTCVLNHGLIVFLWKTH